MTRQRQESGAQDSGRPRIRQEPPDRPAENAERHAEQKQRPLDVGHSVAVYTRF
jgi:hypothetical protein